MKWMSPLLPCSPTHWRSRHELINEPPLQLLSQQPQSSDWSLDGGVFTRVEPCCPHSERWQTSCSSYTLICPIVWQLCNHCVDEPRLIEVIAFWWTFELFSVLSLFEQFLRNLSTCLWAFVSVLVAGAGYLQVCCADIQGNQIPILGLFFGALCLLSAASTELPWTPSYSGPSPVVLNPRVHQNHLEPFIKQPSPSSHPPQPSDAVVWMCLQIWVVSGCPGDSVQREPLLSTFSWPHSFFPPRIGSQTMRRGR